MEKSAPQNTLSVIDERHADFTAVFFPFDD
jgi:hypothetical protein